MAEAKAIWLGHPSYVWRRGQERRLELIRRYVPLEGRRILDVGCGLGMYVARFRQFSEEVYGVDVDPEKVAQASLSLPNIYQAAAEDLPFPDNTFEVVVLNEVLEHVQDDRKAVAEAYRCLQNGGHMIVFVPNRLYPFETHGIFLFGRYHFGLFPFVNYLPDAIRDRFCPHVRIYTARKLLGLFRGLDVEFVAVTHIFPGLDNWAARGSLGRLFRDVMHALEKTPLRCFGISHFIVARKLG